MRRSKLKHFIFVLGFLLLVLWSIGFAKAATDSTNNIIIKQANVQGEPKDSSIQASINGHTLTIVFTESLGQVNIEVSAVSGGETQVESTPTPNGVLFYIYDTGSYIVTFTLPNGDEYYGEFEVMD
ncbi:MAG: DUF3244 domain-containing protein [Bacteroidales bacterium]|nr:DUF3244 domain-containing protein [Bacteroidales bacterium]MBQ6101041.1 DUF3244 domain-containing protein [Bacteroidales bacterium]